MSKEYTFGKGPIGRIPDQKKIAPRVIPLENRLNEDQSIFNRSMERLGRSTQYAMNTIFTDKYNEPTDRRTQRFWGRRALVGLVAISLSAITIVSCEDDGAQLTSHDLMSCVNAEVKDHFNGAQDMNSQHILADEVANAAGDCWESGGRKYSITVTEAVRIAEENYSS